jgi:hypothetical protein
MEDNKENIKLLPELKDIQEMIKRYNAVHPEGCFLFSFIGYKDSDEICPDCGEKCMCEFDENKSTVGICGDIETIRIMLTELRDIAEDAKDEGGIVII